MLIREKVTMKWGGSTRKHYESLGYVFTKKDNEFEVYTDELTDGSNIKVKFSCDYCGIIKKKPYCNLIKSREEIEKDCCYDCASLKHNDVLLKRNKSLAENYPELMREWCFESNEILPNRVTSNSRKRAVWKCNLNHTWEAFIYARTSKQRQTGCPVCRESKGEKAISDILQRRCVPYQREVSFKDLVGEGDMSLRFDFAITDESGDVRFLIEYDGPFHYGEVYTGDRHDKTMRYDKLKENFCEEHTIQLYRIPYHKYDSLEEEIDNILMGKENF